MKSPNTSWEIPLIRKMLQDEAWLAGERRGGPVSPKAPEVQLRVAEILIDEGVAGRLRGEHERLESTADSERKPSAH